MQVAVKNQKDTYSLDMPCEEHVGKSTLKADKQVTCHEEKGSLICTNQSQTIESLLPDEEDLFSGVLDELGCTATANSNDEDFDVFSSNGDMELEGNPKLYFRQWNSMTGQGLNCNQSSSDYVISFKHPSRTLLVKIVDNRVEDSELRVVFEQHGDIQTFNTTCKCQGFVIISYYDIRAATTAFNALQNKPLENEKLHMCYLSPKICGSTNHRHVIRAPEAAISGLNSIDMLQEIKLDVNYPECAKSLMQQFTTGIVSNQARSCQNPNGISFPEVVSSCMNDEDICGVHSPNEMGINAFQIDAPLQANCCYTNSFPSPVRMSSIYNQFWGHTPHYTTDQAFHPQSLPGVISYDSLNLAPVGFTTETKDHLHMLGPYGPSMVHLFGGSSRFGRSGLSGVHHASRCSNSLENYHLNPVIWSHSPPFNNVACAHSTSNCTESTPNSKKCSYSKPRGRMRRIFHGRRDTVSCHTDEKKFELDIERVLHGEDRRTTLMIKNIPNKYSSATLLAAIDEHNQGTYDFIYLPLDFKNKCNMGYAFINMTDPLQIVPFHKSFNGKKWEKFHSGKVACLAYARIQGKAALISHFQESSLMNEDKCCHPILFTTDGPNAGNQEPFPLGPNIHSRRHKNRCNTHEVNENQEIMSTSLEGK